MPDADKLTPADADLAKALAYALRFAGRKRVHNAEDHVRDRAKRLVEHLERAGFVVVKCADFWRCRAGAEMCLARRVWRRDILFATCEIMSAWR
jgi:hypothetical protein